MGAPRFVIPRLHPRKTAPIPLVVRVSRALLLTESLVWMLLGPLLIVGGAIVLRGASGLPRLVNDPVGDPPIGGWVVAVGIVIAGIASWGASTGWSMRRRTRGAYVSALLFVGVWIVLGLVWIVIASSPLPGLITATVSSVILVGLAAPSSFRSRLRRAWQADGGQRPTGPDRECRVCGPRSRVFDWV